MAGTTRGEGVPGPLPAPALPGQRGALGVSPLRSSRASGGRPELRGDPRQPLRGELRRGPAPEGGNPFFPPPRSAAYAPSVPRRGRSISSAGISPPPPRTPTHFPRPSSPPLRSRVLLQPVRLLRKEVCGFFPPSLLFIFNFFFLFSGADLSEEQLQQPRPRRDRAGRMAGGRLPGLLFILHAAARLAAEQEVENLSGLSPNPEKDIFVVRENRTTCLMAEFAAKFIVPYDVWASNYVDLITEQADIPLSRGAEMKGKCGTNESELELSWLDQAYTLKLSFLKEGHNTSRGPEASWKLSRIQFTYDTSERTYFKDAVSPGKHTASSHRLSALVTPAGRSYECQAQQTISLVSSDHQKSVQLLLSEVRLQPFDIPADFVFSEEHKCPVDQREQLEETLPLILGLILGLVIVVTLGIYHIHHKLTASQVQIPRDRSQYKHMG
ncbi:lysosome-associated membrane glycoprotein 5 [Agelaius tricolor]